MACEIRHASLDMNVRSIANIHKESGWCRKLCPMPNSPWAKLEGHKRTQGGGHGSTRRARHDKPRVTYTPAATDTATPTQ